MEAGEQPRAEEDMGGNIEQTGQEEQEEQGEEPGEEEVEQQQQQGGAANVDHEEEVLELRRVPSIASVSPGPETTECSICFRTFPTAALTTLPCGHTFSHSCILNWTQVYDEKAFADCNVRCPMCRTYLLYRCGDVISEHHLRPGVKILPQELTLNCPSYVGGNDTHSVATIDRPWNPRSLAERHRRIAQQQQQQLQNDGNDAGEEEVFVMEELEGLEGPALEIARLNQALAAVAFQGDMPERPCHTAFTFGAHVAAELGYVFPSATMEETFITKFTMANALDTDEAFIIRKTIKRLRSDLDDFKKDYPQFPVADNEIVWSSLEISAERVIQMHRQYKRQHEGFIVLNEVALKYRAEREQAMLDELELFWSCLCAIDRELNRAWDNVEDKSRLIWLRYPEE
ncbi:hypothetical protein F5B19DRAFT_11208 [Rostrohypoxylon terebratum]|nr:hypothetical protein F5B19DRAFT_11208 [Rostrohypoxylon terebratum]